MAPEASTHPTVFVGCPFTPAKRFAEFRRALDLVPLQFVYASSRVRTKHILERIKGDIGAADFSLFDISGWNPNVALELGLADGLGKRYYILFRPGRRRQADAPADLKGLQRFQYTRLRGCAPECLEWQLDEHLVRSLPHARWLWDELEVTKRPQHFVLAMRVLAHFKSARVVTRPELDALVRGTRLPRAGVERVLELLARRGLIEANRDGSRWNRTVDLYRRDDA